MRRTTHYTKLFVSTFLLAISMLFSNAAFSQASVATDQADYPPGGTVYITGSGFQPGESVRLQVTHTDANSDNDSSAAHQPWYVIADSLGNISSTWLVPSDEDEVGATLKLTADGLSSGLHAETLFTDALDWTITVNQTNVCPNKQVTLTFTVTSTGTTGLGCIKITIPSTYTSASTNGTVTSPAGTSWSGSISSSIYTAVASASASTISGGQTISFSITATAPASGTDSWVSAARNNINCTGNPSAAPNDPQTTAIDNTVPTITLSSTSSTSLGCNASNAAINTAFGTATASDNCSGALTPTISDGAVGSTGCARIQTRTWIATDASGNTATASRTVTWTFDNTAPVVSPTSTSSDIGCNPSSSTILSALGSATASDNCSGALTPTASDGAIVSSGCSRSQTRIFTATDACGNSGTASKTITWTFDDTAPVITPASTITSLGCNPDPDNIEVALGTATASDNCSGVLTPTPSDGAIVSSGCTRSQTRTWTVNDACGNTASASHTITWTFDITKPDITLTATGGTALGCNPGTATIDAALGGATFSDNCGGTLTTSVSDGPVGSTDCSRSQTRTWLAADGCGNGATATRTVTWTFDVTAPVITSTSTASLTLGCNPSSTTIDAALGSATASDNCSGTLTPVPSDSPVGSTDCARSQTRTWLATDGCNNTATISRTVNWTYDVTAPVITPSSTESLTLGCNPSTSIIDAALGNATASDNCSGSVTPVPSDSPVGSTDCARSQTRTWLATDGCNNTATISRTVSWTYDVTAPMITPTSTSSNALGCNPNSSTILTALGSATATDNCSGTLTPVPSDGPVGSTDCSRSQTRTWLATDACSNTATLSRTVTWTYDVTAPVITPSATTSTTLGCNPSTTTIDAALGSATASDNCSGALTPSASDGVVASSGCARSQTRTWSATDGCSNSTSISRTVFWTYDITAPSITLTSTGATTLGCNPNSATIDAALGGATFSDDCSSSLTTAVSDGAIGSTDCARSQTRTWLAEDGCGNASSTSRTVTWTYDVTAPVITPSATTATTLGCNPNSATIDAALGSATASDNCSGTLTPVPSDSPIGSTDCSRSQTRTWLATDACSNTATISRTVTWTFDVTAPVITLTSSGSTVLGCNPSTATIDAALGGATATDNCSGALTPVSSDGSVASSGCARSQTRTWLATDGCGNTATISRTVNWTYDISAPVITPTSTINTALGCNPTGTTINNALGNATATDNCSTWITPSPSDGPIGSTDCSSSQTRTWLATDACSNTATISRTVTWTYDVTAPVITPSATTSTALGCNPSTTTIDAALGSATASDNCSGALTPSASDGVVASSGCARSQTRTWSATDGCSNSTSISRTVFWTYDITAPSITLTSTGATTLGCNPNSATIDAALGGATFSDDCSSSLTTAVSDGAIGSTDCARSQTRTWLAEDGCGNASSTSRTVTWTYDVTAPVITPSATTATTLGCNPNSATIDAALGIATASDNCSGVLTPVPSDGAVGSTDCSRSQTRTWLATDGCSNTATISRTVTWTFDVTAPVITLTSSGSTVLGCNPSTATIDAALGGATATDNCSGTLSPVSSDGSVASSGCARSQTRSWIATDGCNNTATASRTVTWTFDISAPVITLTSSGSTVLGCNPSATTINNALGTATASDNCSSWLTPVPSDSPVGSTDCSRSQTRTWLATDACSNTATISRTVTWTYDVTAPVITPTATIANALGCNPSTSTIDAALGSATATDNCSGSLTPVPSDGSVVSSGCTRSQTRTWLATDGCGNTATISRTVNWTYDISAPVITPTSTINTALGCNPTATTINNALGIATASDNCSTWITPSPSDGPVGSTDCSRSQTRTWLATDACSNTATISRTVTWTYDVMAPVITPTATIANALGCNPSTSTIDAALGSATATDNCSGSVTPVPSDGPVISSYCSRSQTRTWLATDGCGNTATISRTVNWTFDITKPVVTPTSTAYNLNCNPSLSDISTALGIATASDNCSGALTPTPSDGPVGSTGCARSQTRTWTVTDNCTNVGTASKTVTWTYDVTAPVITTISTANLSLGCNPTTTTINNALGGATASDECSGALTPTASDSGVGTTGCTRTQTRTWTVTDNCGNTASASRTATWTYDVTKPVITLALYGNTALGCNPTTATIDGGLGGATASDDCSGILTPTASDGAIGSTQCSRSQTRVWTVTDICGNSASASRTVTWTFDVTPPTITAASTSVATNSGLCTYTVVGKQFDATVSDDCSSTAAITLTWSVSGATTNTNTSNASSLSGVVLNFGLNTVTWTAADGCGNTSTSSVTINVNKVTAVTSVTVSPGTRQYSDSVHFVATVTNCSGAGNIGGTVTFKVNGLALGTVAVATDGTATLDAFLLEPTLDPNNPTNGPLNPNVNPKTVLADFSGQDPDYVLTDPTTTLTVNKEDVGALYYNGFEYFSTPTNNCPSTGTINLSAYLKDTADHPTMRGDIRNATVTFTVVDAPNPNQVFTVGVGSITPGDYQQGIATKSFPMNLSGTECNNAGNTFEVWTTVNNYYTGATPQSSLLTLALPGQDLVTGGGHLDLTNSSGCLAGTMGSKMNFGFTMKWNKSGKNLQGQINIMFRKYVNGQWKIYQIKSNAINSMSVRDTTVTGVGTFKIAYISTKANLNDVTTGSAVSLGGNLDLSLTVWDCTTTNGGSLDRIAVSLVGSVTGCPANGLIFSSYFANGATLVQPLSGGNNSITVSSTTSTKVDYVSAQQPEQTIISKFDVDAYPNPSEHQFQLFVKSTSKEPLDIKIFDIAGKEVATMKKNMGETIKFGETLKTGTYIAEVIQGGERKTIKLIKQ